VCLGSIRVCIGSRNVWPGSRRVCLGSSDLGMRPVPKLSGKAGGSTLRRAAFCWRADAPHSDGAIQGGRRFRGGLVVKALRLCVSLNARLESNKEEETELFREDEEAHCADRARKYSKGFGAQG